MATTLTVFVDVTGTEALTEHEVLSAAIGHLRALGEATPQEMMSTMAIWLALLEVRL
jgi:hypothetical protein